MMLRPHVEFIYKFCAPIKTQKGKTQRLSLSRENKALNQSIYIRNEYYL